MSLRLAAAGAVLIGPLLVSGCSGCDRAQSAPLGGDQVRLSVEVVDGIPSDLDVHGDYYRLPRSAWSSFAADGSVVTAELNNEGRVTVHKASTAAVELEGPIRCE